MVPIDLQVDELLATILARSNRAQPQLRVGLVANFALLDKPDEDTEFNNHHSYTGGWESTTATYKRAHSDALSTLKTKKPRETASTCQRANKEAINAAIPNPVVHLTRLYTCQRANCSNKGHLCYNIPTMGHHSINGGDLLEWKTQIQDDLYINVHHPPAGLLMKWQA
jgi:hypothetical protein